VARIPYRQPGDAEGRVREVLETAPPLNIFRLMAQADSAFVPWLRWGGALLGELKLDPVLRELAILRVARLTPGAEYEWVQHDPIALAIGAGQEQVDALRRDEIDAGCFSAAEQAVLQFTTEVVNESLVRDETFAAVADVLSDREIVELIMVIGQYMMVGRVMAALEIDPDEPIGGAALGAVERATELDET
jgi:4-carboxymuconolactone decarboxylase